MTVRDDIAAVGAALDVALVQCAVRTAFQHLVDPWWTLEQEWGQIANGAPPSQEDECRS